MLDFQQKRKLRTVFTSKVTQVVILLLAFFILMSAYNRFLIAREMAERRILIESEIEALENRREALTTEVKYLSNERGIESEMRKQFDVAQPGEQVVIILENDDNNTIKVEEKASSTPKRAWYKFW